MTPAKAQHKRPATLAGFGAILLWSLLAVLTVKTAPIPPFQLTAMAFGIGGTFGLLWVLWTGQAAMLRKISLQVYIFGTCGLFGYHLLYFSALRLAPAAEAGLIAYLWPLLIVLMSGLLPSERLRMGHIIGGCLGFFGASVIIFQSGVGFSTDSGWGYILALMCAFIWSGYSVISRMMGQVPTSAVTVFCLATALLSTGAHIWTETTIWPISAVTWLALIGLGAGPVGLAFFIWDFGVKHGDIQLLGVASYAAPLLSTFVLVLAGVSEPSWALIIASLSITAGALIAVRASKANTRTI